MTAEEQIEGVLRVIDHARAVSVAGKPVTIERDKFEQYPDYEAILTKLEFELAVINIKGYPVLDDVDYRIEIGFRPEAVLKAEISYVIEVLPEFDNVLNDKAAASDEQFIQATVSMPDREVFLLLANNKSISLRRLKTDLLPHRFMRLVTSNPGVTFRRAELLKKLGLPEDSGVDFTELARNSGFNDKELKGYFFKGTTHDKVRFMPTANIPYKVVSNRIKS